MSIDEIIAEFAETWDITIEQQNHLRELLEAWLEEDISGDG